MYDEKNNFGENRNSETGQNVTLRLDEHSDIGKNSEPASIFINFLNAGFAGKFQEDFQRK